MPCSEKRSKNSTQRMTTLQQGEEVGYVPCGRSLLVEHRLQPVVHVVGTSGVPCPRWSGTVRAAFTPSLRAQTGGQDACCLLPASGAAPCPHPPGREERDNREKGQEDASALTHRRALQLLQVAVIKLQVAVHYPVDVPHLMAGAVVFHHGVGLEHGCGSGCLDLFQFALRLICSRRSLSWSSASWPAACAMQVSRFWIWLRSLWHWTTIPVGRWVMRTASR